MCHATFFTPVLLYMRFAVILVASLIFKVSLLSRSFRKSLSLRNRESLDMDTYNAGLGFVFRFVYMCPCPSFQSSQALAVVRGRSR